jgi:hypothetical protein
MPGSNYPDGANLYIAEAVRAAVRAAGLPTPIVAVGKIGTKQLAESVIERGQGDLVGMARALLADPDLPRKWRDGREESVVRCVYGNVCKALDENFRRVDCTLWPKKLGQAPESDDTVPPVWSPDGAGLTVEYKDGRVLVRWRAATDNEAIYGYQVMRSEGDGLLLHYSSVRGGSNRFEDARVVGGARYQYAVRPYDLAGNRGPPSLTVDCVVPREHFESPRDPEGGAKDPGALDACTRVTGQ